jgi:hypothetical protein
MKRHFIIPFIILLFASTFIKGQGIYDVPDEKKQQPTFVPHIYIGPGVGINNISGMMGAILELHVCKPFSLVGGLGLGNWGAKYSAQARFYRRFPIGVFYGFGISGTTGVKNYEIKLDVEDHEEKVNVKMNLHKVNCLNFSIGQQFRLGSRMRLNFELGYAIALTSNFYDIKTPDIVLTQKSKDAMEFNRPGRLILGVAFSIGI